MVLIDATPLQSEHRLRGVGIYLRKLIEAFEDGGEMHPWYLISSNDASGAQSLLPRDRTVQVPRPHRPAQVYWMYNEIALRIGLGRLKPHTFFAPDFNGLIANPYGRTVAVLHDLTALKLEGPKAVTPGQLLSELRWRAYAGKLKQADAIIAVSESSRSDATRLLGIPEGKVEVVHHGVDHACFRRSTGSGRYANRDPYFVHVGARNPNKNQARILEAFKRVAAANDVVQLYFAGHWRESDLEWLDRESSAAGLKERVHHLGFVPEEDLSSLYGNATAFLFPSLEEGFGMPVLEAMASGGPVITSNRSALPEVAGEAALLVEPTSIPEIATAMHRVLAYRPLRERLRHMGTVRAAHFTWDAAAARTATVLTTARRGLG